VDRDHGKWVAAIVQAIEAGTMLDLAPGKTNIDARQADNWSASRQLPGEAIRAALLHPHLKPDPRGLKIRAARIIGEVDLAELHVRHSLQFICCAFERPLNWSRLTISGILSLYACATSSLFLDGAEVKGDTILAELTATGEVTAYSAKIGGNLNLEDAVLSNEGGIALGLVTAEIKGSAILRHLTATGEFRAYGARIGQLELQSATLQNEGGFVLSLDGAEINGRAMLTNLNATGEFGAVSGTIGHQLDLQGATLSNEGGIALNLDGAEVKGPVLLASSTTTGTVSAMRARISRLDLDQTTLNNADGNALSLPLAQLGIIEGPAQWVPYALGALKLFSWILVALLLAGVTGLLRKT
jgi:hypothetical protein